MGDSLCKDWMLTIQKNITVKRSHSTANLNATPTINALNFGVYPGDTKSQKTNIHHVW